AVVYSLVLVAIVITHRDLTLVSYDRDTALVLGKRVRTWELLLQLLTGATIATGVMTVGPVLLFGLLVLPPLAARPLARSMIGFLSLSATIGVLSSLVGLGISFHWDLPLGPAVVMGGTLWMAVVRVASRLMHL
ncbi:MAG: ABC-type Mn2+/Zn2+ transport system permease subunit, partial [Planctomycetota bacterium]